MKTEEDFENWQHWIDPEKLAEDTYKFYKKIVGNYGDKICIMGQGPVFGQLETIYWSIGLANLAKWTRKRPDLIEQFSEKLEEYSKHCITAMMDAGIKIIVLGDDMGYKRGRGESAKLRDSQWQRLHYRWLVSGQLRSKSG